jgi:predicted regulator of amino acid metabolism with ACT domain
MKLKGLQFADVAEIQEAVTDEIKVQKEEFSETVRPCKKPVYMPMELILNKKKLSSIFKKISPKTFGPHCVYILAVGRYLENPQQSLH